MAIDRDAAIDLFDEVARGAVTAAGGDRTHRWAEAEADVSTGQNAQQGSAHES